MHITDVRNSRELAKLALIVLLRGSAPNTELSDIARKDSEKERSTDTLIGKPGEFKTVPVTTTNVEGIGGASVYYGTMAFQVTSNSVKAEKRITRGENLSGFAVINE